MVGGDLRQAEARCSSRKRYAYTSYAVTRTRAASEVDSLCCLMKSSASCSTALSVVSSTFRSWDLTSSQSATSQVFDSKRKKYSAGSIVMRRPSTWMPGRRFQRGSNASGSSTVMGVVSMVVTVSPSLVGRVRA